MCILINLIKLFLKNLWEASVLSKKTQRALKNAILFAKFSELMMIAFILSKAS